MSGCSRPDSKRAVRLALDWAAQQGMNIPERLGKEQLERLRRVFSMQEPWSVELYVPLRAFAHALPRLQAPDAPRVTLGDCLGALNELVAHDWARRHDLSSGTFAALGYAETSAGISAVRSRNLDGWLQHASANREFLLRGAMAARRGTAAVIGAGKLYDVPLAELAERFERLILIDVDGAALAESVELELGDSPLRQRLELVTSDVTGCNETFVRAVSAIFDAERTEPGCYRALLALLALLSSYSGRAPLTLARTLPPLSAVFSTMVLSQLAEPLTRYLGQRFAERFPGSARWQSHELQLALGQFSHRLQHAHVQALLASAPTVTLTSDVSEQYTRLGAASQALPLIGSAHLSELFPSAVSADLCCAEWLWPRVVSTPDKPRGRLLRVNGCLYSAAPSSARA